MIEPVLSLRGVTVGYGRRLVFEDVAVDVLPGQGLGVLGRAGAGKTTLLRAAVGLLAPTRGDIRIGRTRAIEGPSRVKVAYFAGDATVPGAARAIAWGRMGTGDDIVTDRRPIRALSRGTRQLLGLRTVLGRLGLRLIVLDEPWEGLDADGARWLHDTVEAKRDQGAALVVSSQRLQELLPLCDAYLVLEHGRGRVLRAVDLAPSGTPTQEALEAALASS